MRGLWSITTYKKNKALRNILTDLSRGEFPELCDIHVADDNNGEAEGVSKEFGAIYSTGPNVGIARNKNRGIKYFVDNKDRYDFLVLSDDDIHIQPGLLNEFIEASREDREEAIGSFLGGERVESKDDSGYIDPASGEGWFKEFPVEAETDHLIWTNNGSMGICSFYTKRVVLEVGYFKKFKYFYGCEHSEYAARANRVQGKCPNFFPSLKYSSLFISCQNIENNYTIDRAKVDKQLKQYSQYLTETSRGVKLKEMQHNLNLTKERTVEYGVKV